MTDWTSHHPCREKNIFLRSRNHDPGRLFFPFFGPFMNLSVTLRSNGSIFLELRSLRPFGHQRVRHFEEERSCVGCDTNFSHPLLRFLPGIVQTHKEIKLCFACAKLSHVQSYCTNTQGEGWHTVQQRDCQRQVWQKPEKTK